MAEDTDRKSQLVALILGSIGLLVVAVPFATDSNSLAIMFGLLVGGMFFAGAFGVLSPSLAVENPPHRRGG